MVYLFYFCCIANGLICCSLCDMKEEAGAKVKRENNLQGMDVRRVVGAKRAFSPPGNLDYEPNISRKPEVSR